MTSSIVLSLLLLTRLLNREPDHFDYFRGIVSHLAHNGFRAYAPRVGFAERVQDRAKDLAKAVQAVLDETGAAKIHIIAHSMGGLDSRHMIVDEKMQDAVATLTTIGTPHLGTRFADAGLDAGGEEIIDRVLRDLHMDFTGVKDLTGESRKRFNQRAAPSEASNPVHYITYSASQALEHTFKALKLSWKVIDKKEGDNDGLVSITSQEWTERLKGENVEKKVEQFAFPIEADHLNQLGWWDIDELKGVGLFNFRLRQRIRNFENTVKGVYLQIAQHAETLV